MAGRDEADLPNAEVGDGGTVMVKLVIETSTGPWDMDMPQQEEEVQQIEEIILEGLSENNWIGLVVVRRVQE